MTHLEQQIEEYERVEQEKMKERTLATRKIMERLRQDETMHQFDGTYLTRMFLYIHMYVLHVPTNNSVFLLSHLLSKG